MNFKSCPFCKSKNLKDCYVYIQCLNCLAEGPKMNGGRLDEHSDYMDHDLAIRGWNREKSKKWLAERNHSV